MDGTHGKKLLKDSKLLRCVLMQANSENFYKYISYKYTIWYLCQVSLKVSPRMSVLRQSLESICDFLKKRIFKKLGAQQTSSDRSINVRLKICNKIMKPGPLVFGSKL